MEREEHTEYIKRVVGLASESAKAGTGPFGCVVVKDGKVVGEASNAVTKKNDPSAHAEMEAIREASSSLGTFNLEGCVLYASSYPCSMCFGAIYWAHIKEVYYANDLEVASKAGFDDSFIYKELCENKDSKKTTFEHIEVDGGEEPFKSWSDNPNKIIY